MLAQYYADAGTSAPTVWHTTPEKPRQHAILRTQPIQSCDWIRSARRHALLRADDG
ncbi:hypothetical protein APY04_1229 [Hyphomicrobium sulfonivorans]|uniref:Uncharacterized protein n=1 Tax=Hyphomicrobium sulfonivorans TaxID=121290 RepID=A0A125NVK0_HYPSL|nr:hypothetical protein APY04_1229 [Hyphomicrobium sulfonivorans]